MRLRATRLAAMSSGRRREGIEAHDLAQGLPDSFTFTRSSSAWAWVNGELMAFAANEPRITEAGVLIEEARTNKCTNDNANPTSTAGITTGGDAAAVLSVVSDTEALAAAGLSGVCTSGMVYKFDNSAGTAVAALTINGVTGNTNTHTVTAYVRGTGSVQFRLAGVTDTNRTLTDSYERSVVIATPDTSTRNAYAVVPAGSVLYFILNQLEEGIFETTPIEVTGAAATRAPEVLTVSYDAPDLMVIAAQAQTLVAPTVNARLISASKGLGWASILLNSATQQLQIFTNDGASTVSAALEAITPGVAFTVALQLNATEANATSGNSVERTTALSGAVGQIDIGRQVSASNYWNGYIRKVAISTRAENLDKMLARVA